MLSYYYVMAQLPALSVNSVLPFSYERFLDIVEIGMPTKDFEILKQIKLEPPINAEKTGSHFLDAWYTYEKALRFSLATIRAQNLNWAIPESYANRPEIMKAFDVVQVAREACAIEDPLKAEFFLDKTRFTAIEHLKGLHSMDRDALFAYAVMLRLKERIMKFNGEVGRREYNTIYDKILES